MPILLLALALLLSPSVFAAAQSAGAAGTVEGVVLDPTGAVVPNAHVELSNPVSGYKRSAQTDANGAFRFLNVPPNPYHVDVNAPGFQKTEQDALVRSAVPVSLKFTLVLAGEKTEVNVESSTTDLVENVPMAHTDVDRTLFAKLPVNSSSSAVSDVITLASPGVVADSNGFFHPLGDHAQTAFYVDNQPITDQQSKQFSTQLPLNAIQSMELITSAPGAEFGDKTSLVVNAVTRSGLGVDHPFGSLNLHYGSFGSPGEDFAFGFGGPHYGNFLAANSSRSGRFLDTPEFLPIHAIGDSQTIFDRFDYQHSARDTFHLNLFLARNWFQVPNTYDQAASGQDQRQLARTFSVAPGYVRTFGPTTLLTVNPYLRQDHVNYYPSRDPFADNPATIGQKRRLRNAGVRTDLSYVYHGHNIKTGIQAARTALNEDFSIGITDPGFVDETNPGLRPYDLTRGGHLLRYDGHANIKQFAFYAQDQWTLSDLTLTGGVRVDVYDGLSSDTAVEPRIGASYHFKRTGTVVRAAYSRTFETPYNENLILSSLTGQGGLATNTFGAYASAPLKPGRRNQYNAGLQQAIKRWFVVDGDYFWKRTENAFDFGALFNTPITFPFAWRLSKIDGISAKVNLTNIHGFTAFTVLGHTRARFFGPSTGGLIFNSPLSTGAFRIDHDQAFQQTTHVRYQAPVKTAPWIAFTWRYDSGAVAGAVPDLDAVLALTAAQQAAIGFFCGADQATLLDRVTSCNGANFGATRVRIPAPGTADPDRNPPRVAPRHLFDVGVGVDNLLGGDRHKVSLRLMALNLTNDVALYNFLSTFSGTHFVSPRTYQVELGLVF